MKQQNAYSFKQFIHLYRLKNPENWVLYSKLETEFKKFLSDNKDVKYGKDWYYGMITSTIDYDTREPIFSVNKHTKIYTAGLLNDFLEQYAIKTNSKRIKLNKLKSEDDRIMSNLQIYVNLHMIPLNQTGLMDGLIKYDDMLKKFTNLNKIDRVVTKTIIGKIIAKNDMFFDNFYIDEKGTAYVDERLYDELIKYMTE